MDAINEALWMLHMDSPTHRITVDTNQHLPLELLSPDAGCPHLGIV
jgi:hypothetical protein